MHPFHANIVISINMTFNIIFSCGHK